MYCCKVVSDEKLVVKVSLELPDYVYTIVKHYHSTICYNKKIISTRACPDALFWLPQKAKNVLLKFATCYFVFAGRCVADQDPWESVIPFDLPQFQCIITKCKLAPPSPLSISELTFASQLVTTFLFLSVKCFRPMTFQLLAIQMIEKAKSDNDYIVQKVLKTAETCYVWHVDIQCRCFDISVPLCSSHYCTQDAIISWSTIMATCAIIYAIQWPL